MPATLLDVFGVLPGLMLVIARIGGLLVTAPLFSAAVIPRVVKIYLVVTISLAIFPVVSSGTPSTLTLELALFGLVGEVAFGIALGLAVNLTLTAAQVAGMTIAGQSGLAMGQLVDPTSGEQTTVLGQVYYTLAVLVFLAVGGERELVRVLIESFETVPLLGFWPDAGLCEFLVDTLLGAYTLAVRLAAPAVIALLLTSLTLGFLSRTVPQLNVLSIGFSLKVVVAVLVLLATLPAAGSILEATFSVVFESLREGLGILGP